MASVSYGLSRGTNPTYPNDITVGTLAVSTNDVELRMDKTKSLNTQDVIQILEAFIRRLEDGGYGHADLLNI